MLTTKRSAMLFFIINVIVCYIWIVIFRESDWIRSLGTSIFIIVGGTSSFLWLNKAYRLVTNKRKYFWLLLSIGVLSYIISNSIWLYSLIKNGVGPFPEAASVMWLLAYFFFLVALVYKTQLISIYVSKSRYVFNIIVFMTIAIAISVHYLIKPILSLAENSLAITVLTLAYPVTNLGILFVTITLYYLSQYSKEKSHILIIIVGFFVQIVADSIFTFQTIAGTYQLGSFIDPLWLIAIFIIGLAGLSTQESSTEPEWEIKNDFKSKETIFPYISIIFLLVLVISSYQWTLNALSIGLIFTFLTIIVRQLLIMKQNENLLDKYRHLAYHDPLTGLNNRASFDDELHQIMKIAKQNNYMVALLLIDLDQFKTVNDTLGHHIGDSLLIEASEQFKKSIGPLDRLYRLGGDEFVIVLPDTSENSCIVTAEMILNNFSVPFIVNENKIAVTPSIGVSLYPENAEESEELLKNADTAMYLAKGSGKNSFRFYNSVTENQQRVKR